MTGRVRLRVDVHGVVQGVGFRPFVYSCAAALNLAGCVRNDSSGAVIEVEGDAGDVENFLRRLRDRP
ncbi:acylphosphatase, partial [Mycolicibacterium pulveris]